MAGKEQPFASNIHNVSVQPVNFTAPGAPTLKTYHGASIENNENQIIGRIQSWNPTNYSREGVHVFELNSNTWGKSIDYVPGKQAGGTIAMSRFEVWGQEVERALMGIDAGTKPWASLIEQLSAFTINEYIFRGETGNPVKVHRRWIYTGCWFQERNESAFESEGDGRITAEATIAFVNRVLLIGDFSDVAQAPVQNGISNKQ